MNSIEVDSYTSTQVSGTTLLVRTGETVPDEMKEIYTIKGRSRTWSQQEGIDAIKKNGYYIYKMVLEITERVVPTPHI